LIDKEFLARDPALRVAYAKWIPYLRWYATIRDAETGQYLISPFPLLDYPSWPYFETSVLDIIKGVYLEYLESKRPKIKGRA